MLLHPTRADTPKEPSTSPTSFVDVTREGSVLRTDFVLRNRPSSRRFVPPLESLIF